MNQEILNTLKGWIQTNANNTAELAERIDELSRQGSTGGAIVESAQPRQRISLTTSGNELQLIINNELVSTVDLSEYLDDINIQTVSFDDATDTLTITETDGQIHNIIVSGFAESEHTHTKEDITDFNDDDYATAEQGELADTAVQPADLVWEKGVGENSSQLVDSEGSALGDNSTAAGSNNTASSFAEAVVGSFATEYSANSVSDFDAGDKAFVVGNGDSATSRSNALTIWKSGAMQLGPVNLESLTAETGMVAIDDTDGVIKYYDGSVWNPLYGDNGGIRYPQAVISNISEQISPSATTTITVTGDFITPDVAVQVPGLTVTNVTWISSNEFTFDVTSLDVGDNYDVIVSTASGSETFVDAIQVVLSAWVDLRLGGASLTDGTAAGNDIRYRTGMSMSRDAQGMSFSGLNPWGSWVKFESLGWTRGFGTSLEWIFTSPVAAMMIGVGSDATDEASNSQFFQAETVAYFQNANTFWGLYGNNRTVGGSATNNNFTSVPTGTTFKILFTDDGGRGGTFTLYQLPSADPSDWDDVSTILTTFTIAGSINPDEPNLLPFIIPRSGGAQRFIAIKVM